MKSILTSVCCILSAWAFSQSADISSATVINTPFYTTGVTIPATLSDAVPSGLPTLDGAPGNDDIFMQFTAVTQGIKLDFTTLDFDMILEVWDGATLKLGVNNVAGNAGESLWIPDLTVGVDYVIRVYSLTGVGVGNIDCLAEHLPAVNVRDFYIPTNATFDANDGVPGYRMNQIIARETVNVGNGFDANINDFIEATTYKFTNVATGDIHYKEVLGISGGVTLNSVTDGGLLCPDESYDVEVQIKLEGNYCGYHDALGIFTEPEPMGTLSSSFANQIYDLDGNMQMNFIGQGQFITWYFSTNNGETVLDPYNEPNPANTWVQLENIDCLRYGKIYDVQIDASYCGIQGPLSDPITIYTVPYPKTRLQDEFFFAGTLSPFALVAAQTIQKAEQYAFQFAPIEPGDPNMIPTGPALVAYSSNNSTFLGPLGLEIGQTYRAGVKTFIQYGDGCDDPQESDYGLFCEILINPVVEPVDDLIDLGDQLDDGYGGSDAQTGSIKDVIPNHNERAFVLDLADLNLEGTGILSVFDLNGRLVQSRNIFKLEEADYLFYDLSNELATGSYVIALNSQGQSFTQKVYIP